MATAFEKDTVLANSLATDSDDETLALVPVDNYFSDPELEATVVLEYPPPSLEAADSDCPVMVEYPPSRVHEPGQWVPKKRLSLGLKAALTGVVRGAGAIHRHVSSLIPAQGWQTTLLLY